MAAAGFFVCVLCVYCVRVCVCVYSVSPPLSLLLDCEYNDSPIRTLSGHFTTLHRCKRTCASYTHTSHKHSIVYKYM